MKLTIAFAICTFVCVQALPLPEQEKKDEAPVNLDAGEAVPAAAAPAPAADAAVDRSAVKEENIAEPKKREVQPDDHQDKKDQPQEDKKDHPDVAAPEADKDDASKRLRRQEAPQTDKKDERTANQDPQAAPRNQQAALQDQQAVRTPDHQDSETANRRNDQDKLVQLGDKKDGQKT